MKHVRILVAVLAAAAMAGCFSAVHMHDDTLRSRASFDLRCPAPQLRVTELDNRTAGVEGCGQRATYIYNSPANTWVLNSPAAEQPGDQLPPGAPPPPAAPPPEPPPGAPPPPPPHG